MCSRRLLPFSVTRGLEYSTETVAGPICWVTVARWLSPLGGRDSPSARATLENNAHVQRKVLFMASGTTPHASHRINPRIPNGTTVGRIGASSRTRWHGRFHAQSVHSPVRVAWPTTRIPRVGYGHVTTPTPERYDSPLNEGAGRGGGAPRCIQGGNATLGIPR